MSLKHAYEELCHRYNPNLWITLATNQPWSVKKMTSLIGEFAYEVDRKGIGRKFFKQPITMRADGIFFIEKCDTNIHAHGVVRIPYDLPDTTEIWRDLCSSGSVDVQQTYSHGFASYSTKEFELHKHSEDQVVFLTDFMSVTSRCG